MITLSINEKIKIYKNLFKGRDDIFAVRWEKADKSKSGYTPVLIMSMYADYESGDVKLDEDTIDFKWISFEEAKDYDLIEGILEEIEMVEKIIKNNKNS